MSSKTEPRSPFMTFNMASGRTTIDLRSVMMMRYFSQKREAELHYEHTNGLTHSTFTDVSQETYDFAETLWMEVKS